jgi:uncharacterized NAD(P)/FAD-binding protein YdhS
MSGAVMQQTNGTAGSSKRGGSRFTVAILGGGFAGAALAAQLLRKADPNLSVVLIERGPGRGRGLAYSTQCAGHLLNVPAQDMSVFADDAEHFLRWARLHFDSGAKPTDYLPRKVYGEYVESLLAECSALYGNRLEWLQDEAEAVGVSSGDQGGDVEAEIELRSGRKVFADKVVLALGNFLPADLRLPGKSGGKSGGESGGKSEESPRYVRNPWAANALEGIPAAGSVLLIGSGLTSVDVAISLRAREFHGPIHVLSRHGLLPQTHQPVTPWQPVWDEKSPRTVRGLMRLVRTHVHAAEMQGVDWRAVMESLRPHVQQIWKSLPLPEQRRFVRHLRAYWDVHRHRVAPEIGRLLTAQLADGQIHVHAGRIAHYQETADKVDVTYYGRKSGMPIPISKTLQVDRVINCTGPEADCRRVASPLLSDLLRRNLVRPDPLALGLDTTKDGAVIDAEGVPSKVLYALGPIRKGNLWETIAVPEIRVQASDLAVLFADYQRTREQMMPSVPAPAYG